MKQVVTAKCAWKYVILATSSTHGRASAQCWTSSSVKMPMLFSTETTSRACTNATARSPLARVRESSYSRSATANRPSWSKKSGHPLGSTRTRSLVRAEANVAIGGWYPMARIATPRLTGGSAADVGHLDARAVAGLGAAQLGVAVAAVAPDPAQQRGQLLVGRAVAERPPQVAAVGAEQAGVELALGRQAGPCAVAAEGAGDRGDDADLAGAVDVAEAVGDLARVARRDRLQRPAGRQPVEQLLGGHDVVQAPAVGGADVHELAEAKDDAGAAEAPGHVHDRAVVDVALDHHVDLDRETGLLRCLDALEHPGDREADVVHGLEDVVVERVEADRDTVEAGVAERLGLCREQGAVGGQGEVGEAVRPQRREHRDERLEVAAEQRLAAGQADLGDACCQEQPRQALDLLEGQQLLAAQKHEVVAEHLLRHAVGAAEVAAIGDRDAQIAERPCESVGQCGHLLKEYPSRRFHPCSTGCGPATACGRTGRWRRWTS